MYVVTQSALRTPQDSEDRSVMLAQMAKCIKSKFLGDSRRLFGYLRTFLGKRLDVAGEETAAVAFADSKLSGRWHHVKFYICAAKNR